MAVPGMNRIKAAFGFKRRAKERFFPKDETLRLVLSEEERDFISDTIRKQRFKIIFCLSYLVIFLIAYYGFRDFFYDDYIEQYAQDAAGLEPDAYYDGMNRLARWGIPALLLMGLATPITAALSLDGLYRLIKFSRYRKEHREFLRKYDRERLYYGP